MSYAKQIVDIFYMFDASISFYFFHFFGEISIKHSESVFTLGTKMMFEHRLKKFYSIQSMFCQSKSEDFHTNTYIMYMSHWTEFITIVLNNSNNLISCF